MRRFYVPLVAMLGGDDPRCRVDQPARTTLELRLDTDHGSTVFRLRQTPLRLVVRWANESPDTGTHGREWTFFKFTSQRAMKDRIYDDLLAAHRTMMRS